MGFLHAKRNKYTLNKMAKKHRIKTSTSTQKINSIFNKLNLTEDNTVHKYLQDKFTQYVDYDIQYIRDCSEQSIVDEYISELYSKYDDTIHTTNEQVDKLVEKIRKNARNSLANTYAPDIQFDNTIDRYFNDVKREYIKHPMGESELYDMTDDNRDIFIKNNLKTVIDCAKRYRGMGVDFEDLIQIGNMGLLKAWERFDSSKSDLQNSIINSINDDPNEKFAYDDAEYIVSSNFKYPKLLPQTLNKLPEDGFDSKEEFIEWTKNNIKKASFASLGFIWARAAITAELNAYSNIIRIPKSVRNGNEKVTFINLDSMNPHTGDNFTDDETFELSDEAFIDDDNNIENMERKDMFKKIVSEAIYKLDALSRRIVMKRFGIDLPYQLSISDIAANEGISQREVKSVLDNAMTLIASNISDDNKNIIQEIL